MVMGKEEFPPVELCPSKNPGKEKLCHAVYTNHFKFSVLALYTLYIRNNNPVHVHAVKCLLWLIYNYYNSVHARLYTFTLN